MSAEGGRRRVYFVVPSLRAGGAERVITTLLRTMDRGRLAPTLVVLDLGEATFRDEIPADLPLIDLGCKRVLTSLPKLIRLIWAERPAVLFSTLSHLNLAIAAIRPLLPRSMVCAARETSIVSQTVATYRRPALWSWAYKALYGRLDFVICQSRFMRDDLLRHSGVPADRAIVINNPVDAARIQALSQTPGARTLTQAPNLNDSLQLVAVGRLSHEKGFDILVRAISLVRERDVRLTLLGEGPLRAELEQTARDCGVAHQIEFAGFVANPYPLIRQADALVLSSRFEGFPNVVLEALACGTPVIATPAVGGTREILDEVGACAVTNDISAQDLAHAIERFRRGTRVPVSAVDRYLPERITRRYEEILG